MGFARVVHRLRFAILAVWLVAVVVGFIGGERVVYDGDVLVYFDKASEERQAFDAIEERFGRSQEVVSVIVPREGRSLATPDALLLMAELASAIAQRPEVAAVRTPLSLIEVEPSDVLRASQAERSRLADRLAEVASRSATDAGSAERASSGNDAEEAGGADGAALLAPDATLAAVAAIVPAVANNEEGAAIAAAHRAIAREVASRFPLHEVLQTGRIAIDAAFLRESRDDVRAYSGLQLAILAGIILLALGSLSLTAAILVLVIGIVGGSVGAVGWSGFALNGISSAAPAVLMGLTVASAIHIAIAWQNALRVSGDRVAAVAIAYTRNAKPVILSALTTMISFLILNIAEAPPFRDLGNLVAIGLIAILAACFTVLPALLLVLPRSVALHRRSFETVIAHLGMAAAAARRPVLGTTLLVSVAAGFGVAAIVIDDTFSHYFDERYEVRRATDLFEARLSGTTIIDVAIDTRAAGAVFDPPTVAAAGQLTGWLEARPEVARVDSLSRLTRAGADDPEAFASAMDEMVRQGVPRLFDEAGQHLRFSVVMRGVSSRDTLAFAADARSEAQRVFQGMGVAVTGLPVLSAGLSLGSARAMVVGMGLALGAISLVLLVTLRNARLGFISLMPNVLPVAMAFGLWGVLVGEISFAATVVGALTYGIVVDDTVHLLTKYQDFRRRMGTREAIGAAFASAGVAVIVTSLALALSFLPFALSGFLVNHQFGALTALTLGAALLADLIFLPALIALVDGEPDEGAARRRRPVRGSAPLKVR